MAEGQGGNSFLTDLGGLSAPTQTLVEQIFVSCRRWREPAYIESIAKAEAKAEIIREEAAARRLSIKDQVEYELLMRARDRLLNDERQRQLNIEAIGEKASPQIEDWSRLREIDPDWLMQLKERSKDVSDEEMQTLWAKVLAGEINAPGRYSKRLLSILETLDKRDAEAFHGLCKFFVEIDGISTLLIYSYNDRVYNEQGVTYDSLATLASLGLIVVEKVGYGVGDQNIARARYFDHAAEVSISSDPVMQSGLVMLLPVGKELASLVTHERAPLFWLYLITRWKNYGYYVVDQTTQGSEPIRVGE